MMESMMKEAEQLYGSMEEALANLASQGKQNHSFARLAPATEHVAFAVGLDGAGAVNTEAVSRSFRTEELSEAAIYRLLPQRRGFHHYPFRRGVPILLCDKARFPVRRAFRRGAAGEDRHGGRFHDRLLGRYRCFRI